MSTVTSGGAGAFSTVTSGGAGVVSTISSGGSGALSTASSGAASVSSTASASTDAAVGQRGIVSQKWTIGAAAIAGVAGLGAVLL